MSLPVGKYTLSEAMSRQEGFYVPGSRSNRNNNPGNICWDGPNGYAAAHGATRGDGGEHTDMAVFPTVDLGMAARRHLLSVPARFKGDNCDPIDALEHGYMGARIEQIIYRYCPPNAPGNTPEGTETYTANVARWMQRRRRDILTPDML